ncbi:MAG TPA: sigma-70 family RNA polymerase sigma factor [Terriglobales bacterium]|nr:sigma-70 family RNA polymerase sigma factor [Terriglobales bacterium]
MDKQDVVLDRLNASDDLELVHAAKAGNMPAFDELVRRYDRQLFRVAQHITRNYEDAQDAVQEAFLKAFEHLALFEEKSKFSTWLVRIAINQALMKLRRQRAATMVSIDEEPLEDSLPVEIADWRDDPEKQYKASELREILMKALNTLSHSLRIVFVLRDMEGLSVEETANVLTLSIAAVKTRLLRARLQLRACLTRYFETGAEGSGPALARYRVAAAGADRWRIYV